MGPGRGATGMISRRTFCTAAAAAAGLRSLAARAGRAEAELGGRPFSDPARTVPMPAEWTARPIARPAHADLALAIDQQLFPALRPLVEDWARMHRQRVALQEGTCGIASSALAEKSADITGMCCPPGALDRLPGVRYHTIGVAALALITHPANPLDDITLAQARRLFGGDIRSWAELPVSGVGDGAGRVRTVTRLHCAARPGHWRLLLDDADRFALDMTEAPAIADVIRHVAGTPGAIGYETLWHVRSEAARGAVRPIRLNGIAPDDDAALAAGRYPLYRTFSISSWSGAPAADPSADALVRHLVDNAGGIDPSFGIVPVQRLRAAGWRFVGDEVVGEPGA